MFVNKVIDKLNCDCSPDNLWGDKYHISSSWGGVEIEVGKLLYSLVRCYKPKTIVECGCAHGYSSLHMAQGLKDNGFGKLYTCDILDICIDITDSRLKEAGLGDFVSIYKCKGSELKDKAGISSCDFMFLDSDSDGTHPYEFVSSEFNLFSPLLSDDGVVVLHDTVCCDGPKKLFNELLEIGWGGIKLPTCRGISILQKVR